MFNHIRKILEYKTHCVYIYHNMIRTNSISGYSLYIYFIIDLFLFLSKDIKAMFRVGNSSELSTMTKRNTENRCFTENIIYLEIL